MLMSTNILDSTEKRDRVDKGFSRKMDRLRQQPEERKETCWRAEQRRGGTDFRH